MRTRGEPKSLSAAYVPHLVFERAEVVGPPWQDSEVGVFYLSIFFGASIVLMLAGFVLVARLQRRDLPERPERARRSWLLEEVKRENEGLYSQY